MAHVGRRSTFLYLFSAILVTGVFCWNVDPSLAATKTTKQRANELQVGNSTTRVTLFDKKFRGGATVAAADVDGDGVDEYIVGAGATGGSQVQIYKQDLTLVRSFYAFPKDMKDGINVAAGDLDGDGQAEIIVAPQPGHTPQVEVFSAAGKKLREFTAFESNFAGGLNVAVMPARLGVAGQIVVSSGFGREAEIRVYDSSGKKVVLSWSPFGKGASNGAVVAAGWSDTFGEPILLAGPESGAAPLIQAYGVNSKTKLAQWMAYGPKTLSGISLAYRNDMVITGPAVGGGPDIEQFTVRGQVVNSFLAYESTFRGGVNVAAAVLNGVVTAIIVPTTVPTTAGAQGKSIVVNLTKQTLTMYVRGQAVSIRKVSSGKWSTPTPTGTFKVHNKIPVAYSRAYGLYMENWMAFTADGSMGLHSLPFWKLKNGGRLYEGATHIGTPVSHGCIRQTLAESKTLYDWTPIGTPVIITR